MKVTVIQKVEKEAVAIEVITHMRYIGEDVPADLPMMNNEIWHVTIDIDTGKIRNWPQGHATEFHAKVCDGGTYHLLDAKNMVILSIEEGYVPNGILPGEYGDYLIMQIAEDGTVTNWPTYIDLGEFETHDD